MNPESRTLSVGALTRVEGEGALHVTLKDDALESVQLNIYEPPRFFEAFLRGRAHLYNLVPYQRRAQHAGQCGVEVEGGRVPTADWFLN